MRSISAASRTVAATACTVLLLGILAPGLEAHGVSGKDAVFLQGLQGRAIGPLLYLGAKHMVTGYDHLLFLVGVIFFLYRLKDVLVYVSLFTLGHSVTLLGAVLVFGLFHGLGLATKLQDFALAPDGLVANIVSFNIGVEVGQGLALTGVLIGLTYWRTRAGFLRHALACNGVVMACGLLLVGYQVSGYFLSPFMSR